MKAVIQGEAVYPALGMSDSLARSSIFSDVICLYMFFLNFPFFVEGSSYYYLQAAYLRVVTDDWLQTAKIKEINELMREAGGLLKIENILPLFPDFVQIDNFKEAICQSLEDYNSQIAGLKSEMDDVTRISDALR